MPAVPKPKHQRRTKTRKERGKITQRVAEEVHERAGGVCERCGLPPVYGSYRDRLELAHLVQRSQLGTGDPWNVVALCGPSVNTDTCHNLIDYQRKTHREWVENKIAELEQRYVNTEWDADGVLNATDVLPQYNPHYRYCHDCGCPISEEREDLFCSDACQMAYSNWIEINQDEWSDE